MAHRGTHDEWRTEARAPPVIRRDREPRRRLAEILRQARSSKWLSTLGEQEVPLGSVHYGLRMGDRVAFIRQHRAPRQPRVENGSRGQITSISDKGTVKTPPGARLPQRPPTTRAYPRPDTRTRTTIQGRGHNAG